MPTKQKFSTREEITVDSEKINVKKRKLHEHITQCKDKRRLHFYSSLQECNDETLEKLTNVFSIVLKRRLC